MKTKWPKQIPELSEVQQKVRDEWMRYWHEELPSRYGIIEEFNHGFPLAFTKLRKLKMRGGGGQKTLEVGAGLGEHICYECLENQSYHVIELRGNMAEVLRERFPDVTVTIGDIQAKTSYSDAFFDRVIAIHVLEHLPYLPAALSEVHRMLKPDGIFSVVIPCEGGLAQSLAREISSVRMFKKKFGDTGVDYRWLITKTEHVNAPSEIFKEIEKYFTIEHKEYFPLKVPFVFCNLCIGMHLQKKAL